MHKAFPSGTIEAAPSTKPEEGEEGEEDNVAKEASGYKPQLEPAPDGKFGAAPPQKGSSAEEANDPKGAVEPQAGKKEVKKSGSWSRWGFWQ